MAAEKLSAKQAAIELGTDARTLRKFLRSDACPMEPVGQGARYEFTKGEVNKLKKLFTSWSGAPKKKAEKVIEAPVEEEVPEDEEAIEEIDIEDEFEDDFDNLEPDDDDLEEIDFEDIDLD